MKHTMTDQRPANRSRRSGRHWLCAAVAVPLSPLLFRIAVQQNHGWHACVAHQGSPPMPTQGPCAATYSWMALATLGFWALALAATVTGFVIGIVEGRHRRRFAHGRWIGASVVGLCAPWALLAYALGYGVGRFLPVPHPDPIRQARQGGWRQAVWLYAALASGQQPPAVFAPDLLAAGTVYLDVPLRYSRCCATDVTYQPGTMFVVGSPGVVAGAAIGRLIGTSIGHLRAASLSRRQWRGHRIARVVVTATATWCEVGGRWLRFDHNAVMEYRMGADQSCILTFGDAVPLRLYGPSAWCHAVLFAYLRYAAPGWQTAPFLHPLRQAAQQLLNAPR
jgi:hypothetical protein